MITEQTLTTSISQSDKIKLKNIALAVSIAFTVRIAIYIWLYNAGYFYGYPWDTFSRTFLSYSWYLKPFLFTPGGGYWLPFQFWIVGFSYLLLSPFNLGSDIWVPVAINNLFFIGTLIVIYRLAFDLGGKVGGFSACILASVFSGDVFTTYSALSEPIWVFFIICSAYYLSRFFASKFYERTVTAGILSVLAILAGITHYIGWLLLIFVCFLFVPTVIGLVKTKSRQVLHFLLLWLSMALIPTGWLFRNYIVFNDFLRPFRVITQYEQGYIGQMPILDRALVSILTLFGNFPAAAWMGLMCIILWTIKNPKILVYLSGIIFVFFGLCLTTLMAYSSPYREPRYFVFLILGLIPLIAYTGVFVVRNYSMRGKILVIILILIYMQSNLHQIYTFKNYFSADVPQTAKQALSFLQKNPITGTVIIETDSFAEQTVIPVTSKYYWKFEHVTPEVLSRNSSNLRGFFGGYAAKWLGIVKNGDVAGQARQQGLIIQQIGSYYLISP